MTSRVSPLIGPYSFPWEFAFQAWWDGLTAPQQAHYERVSHTSDFMAGFRIGYAAERVAPTPLTACPDCVAKHPRFFVPSMNETIHTLPGGNVITCAAVPTTVGAAALARAIKEAVRLARNGQSYDDIMQGALQAARGGP